MKKTPKSLKKFDGMINTNPSKEARMAVKILKAERAVIKAVQKWAQTYENTYSDPYYQRITSDLVDVINRLNKLKESK